MQGGRALNRNLADGDAGSGAAAMPMRTGTTVQSDPYGAWQVK